MDVEVQLPQLFPTMLGVIVTIYPFFWAPTTQFRVIGKETPLQSCMGTRRNDITTIRRLHPAQTEINLQNTGP